MTPLPEPRRLQGDHGQVAPMTVILVVAILALSGLVLDGGRLFAAKREASSTASGAARAGAQAVDTDSARAAGTRLDRTAAANAARQYLSNVGATGNVTVTDQEVTVTVTETAHPILLSLIGMGDRDVTGQGTARIARGL